MKTNRKNFLSRLTAGILGSFTFPNLMAEASREQSAVIVQPDEGETYWIGTRNSPLTIMVAKDTQGFATMSFCRELIAPGESIPLHKHLNEDELIFVHRGEGTLTIEEHPIEVREGSVALIPKGVWHSMSNSGKDTLTMVFSYSPAGFEGYFREFGSPAGTAWAPKSSDEYKRLNEKWGIVYR